MRKVIISAIAVLLLPALSGNGSLCAQGQEHIYFVDGFHGGVYGHYPMQTYTDYMSDLLEKYPQWRMCLEIEPETWDTVAVRTPEAYRRFAGWAGSDRVEFTNPAYAQPYMYNISGESIIRQLDYGIRKIHSHFPDVEFYTYAVEEPCFTSALPQILHQFGFKYASLKCPNTCWGGYSAPYGGELVNWTGPDGTSILTSPRYACEGLQEGSVWQTTAWGNEDGYIEACRKAGIKDIVGMCYQDAGWTFGPWIGYADSTRNGSVYVTWKEYFEEKTPGRTDDDYIFSQEDVRPALMWGSQVLQTIARQVRGSENILVQAEKTGAIAGLANGFRYSKGRMDEAWRTLMLAQHHDSWIVPYNGLNSRGTWADNIALWTESTDTICGNIIDEALSSFSAGRPAKGGKLYVKVLNTTGYSRSEVVSVPLPSRFAGYEGVSVKDASGKALESVLDLSSGTPELVFAAEVPAFGYTVVSVEELRPGRTSAMVYGGETRTVSSGEAVVENDMYRIVFDASRGGVITSLVDKSQDGKEYVDRKHGAGLNELRGFFYEEGMFHSSAGSSAEVTVADNGLVKTVTVRGTIARVPYTQTVVLREGDRKIDCSLRIDWDSDVRIGKYAQENGFNANRRGFYDTRYALNVLFPVALDAPQLYKNAPFDVCRSRLEDTFFETWDNIKHNVILNWVDLAGKDGGSSLALFSDHTTSYSYGSGFPLGLTVQMSGGGLWGRDYKISRPSVMRYAIVPNAGEWDSAGIQEESAVWNEPLLCSTENQRKSGAASYIDVSGTGYEISAAYMTDNGLVLRLFNASGDGDPVKVKLGFNPGAVSETDLSGNVTGTPAVTRSGKTPEMEVAMPRFGIRTYLISL